MVCFGFFCRTTSQSHFHTSLPSTYFLFLLFLNLVLKQPYSETRRRKKKEERNKKDIKGRALRIVCSAKGTGGTVQRNEAFFLMLCDARKHVLLCLNLSLRPHKGQDISIPEPLERYKRFAAQGLIKAHFI